MTTQWLFNKQTALAVLCGLSVVYEVAAQSANTAVFASKPSLSAEAQQYMGQDPNAVFQAMRTPIKETGGADDIVGSGCPVIPAQGLSGLTNEHYYFLSEIGGCAQLACFLKQVPSSVHAFSTLIVDQACSGANTIKETLVLPNRFTLAGVGIDGAGVLGFDLPDNVPAIRFSRSPGVTIRMATIRDLNLAGGCCGQVGIDVSNSQFVYSRTFAYRTSPSACSATTRFLYSSTKAACTTTPSTS